VNLDLFAPRPTATKPAAPTLHHGDCLDVLRTLPDASVDSVVTDPPAGIAFMGKAWDEDKGGRRQWIAWLAEVMAEALRVLKPGGHALVWALPRTSHWTATALEDAGFEVRDCLVHVFGSGFPKSHNLAKQWQGWGTALKPASEHWWLVRKPLVGTVAANVERYGTGALNIDASRVNIAPDDDIYAKNPHTVGTIGANGIYGAGKATEYKVPAGRWPPNLLLSHTEDCAEGACADGCAVAEMDGQSGTTRSRVGKPRGSATSGDGWGMTATGAEYADSGGASRFFPVFRYQAKPSRAEREAGLSEAGLREAVVRTGMGGDMPTDDQGKQRDRFSKVAANTHPTVKSIGLMDWLIRLVTPLGGVVLDPFLGSGTTGVAAAKGGFGFIGIEREAEYLAIARARIEAAE